MYISKNSKKNIFKSRIQELNEDYQTQIKNIEKKKKEIDKTFKEQLKIISKHYS